jgi:hypothetical protein
MQLLAGLLGAVLGALVAGVVTYATTRSKMRLEMEYAHDRTLSDKRLEHYQRLFHISRCIPRRWRAGEEPSREDLARYNEDFHNWYFGEQAGGLFLTPQAKELYLRIRNTLSAASHPDGSAVTVESPLTPDESHMLRQLVSELRHQLVEDVGAAHPPRLRWTRLAPTVTPPITAPVD